MDLLTPLLTPYFHGAGWIPDRTVVVPDGVPFAHPAHAILRSFSGLTVGKTGDGLECATDNVAFGHIAEKGTRVLAWEVALATQLIGIATIHNEHGELFIDATGRMFTNSIIHPAFAFAGESFAEGIERLLTGVRQQPMLLPDDDSIMFYGTEFCAGDPAVLTPDALNALNE
ncbi:MAG TPA: SUKH-3 domain-containing protein [Sphingomonas sp.]|nr:SUKH-3 domain-containing protein [Sphingomonas sp.]